MCTLGDTKRYCRLWITEQSHQGIEIEGGGARGEGAGDMLDARARVGCEELIVADVVHG